MIELLSNEYLISGFFLCVRVKETKTQLRVYVCVFNHHRNQIGSNSTIRIQMLQLIGLKSISNCVSISITFSSSNSFILLHTIWYWFNGPTFITYTKTHTCDSLMYIYFRIDVVDMVCNCYSATQLLLYLFFIGQMIQF